MSEYFYCDLSDKSIKKKSETKHLNSKDHKSLNGFIRARYSVIDPDFQNIEDILKNYVLDYNKKFESYSIICKWKLHFSDILVSIKSELWYSVSSGYDLRKFL